MTREEILVEIQVRINQIRCCPYCESLRQEIKNLVDILPPGIFMDKTDLLDFIIAAKKLPEK